MSATSLPSAYIDAHPTRHKLVDEGTQKTVGKAHSAHHLFDKRQMRVDFDPELDPIIDVVLLAFIICEEEHRENQQAAAGT